MKGPLRAQKQQSFKNNWVCVHVHSCLEVRGQCWVSLAIVSYVTFWTRSIIEPQVHWLSRQSGQWAPGRYLALTPQHLGNQHMLLCLTFMSELRVQTEMLRAAHNQGNHLPRLSFLDYTGTFIWTSHISNAHLLSHGELEGGAQTLRQLWHQSAYSLTQSV